LAAGSAKAISKHALLLLPQLRLLHLQRKQVADRTQQLLDQMATSTNDFPMSQNIVTSQCCSLCLVLDASSQRPCWSKDHISFPSGIITP
jgi:hypothetical protein